MKEVYRDGIHAPVSEGCGMHVRSLTFMNMIKTQSHSRAYVWLCLTVIIGRNAEFTLSHLVANLINVSMVTARDAELCD